MLQTWNAFSKLKFIKTKSFHKSDEFSADIDSKIEELDLEKGRKSITVDGKIIMTAMGERFRKRFGNFIPTQLDSRTQVKLTEEESIVIILKVFLDI